MVFDHDGGIEKILVPDRNMPLLFVLKNFFHAHIENRSNTHIEMHSETEALIRSKEPILYVATHKSLWETLGIPYAINKKGGQIPYILMGDNLIKGKEFEYILKKLGVIYVVRDPKRRLRSSVTINGKMNHVLSEGHAVLYFAEGTRAKDGRIKEFKDTGFQAAIDVSNVRMINIVAVNTDYSDMNIKGEGKYFFSKSHGAYTFKLHHALYWLRHMEDIYISFGAPFEVKPTDERKLLAERFEEECKGLFKILPINVVSEAIKRAGTQCDKHTVYRNIEQVLKELEPHRHRFRDIEGRSIEDIFHLANIPIDGKLGDLYNLYSGYICHLLPQQR